MRSFLRCSTVAIATMLFTISAWAHHPMGGETPSTLWQGLLSGLGHPIIGMDHFAFIVAIGLVSAFARLSSPAVPLGLVAATVLGASLKWLGIYLPYAEVTVAISVVTAGLLVFRTPIRLKTTALAALVAALFHGYAYGEAIIGAEPAPLGAYLLGFSVIQMAIAGLAFFAGCRALNKGPFVLGLVRSTSASTISAVGLFAISATVLS
jgi:urease accessory protein